MGFEIATLTLKNGARLGISPLPGRDNSGLRDVATLLRWNPDAVISMTETVEMERHNMGDLGGLLQQAGVGWHHFPIRDFGAPSENNAWSSLSFTLHEILNSGGAVLAHCYGGHGRSGMILLRVLVERGILPQKALEMLRDIRPGAVETDAQFQWASSETN